MSDSEMTTGEKWAFVRPCGCVYGVQWDLSDQISTPIQAWAAFYKGAKKDRKRAEREGCTVRLWKDGDRLILPKNDPHQPA